MRTDYPGHERQYRKRKAAGYVGWETAEGLEENLAAFAAALSSPSVPIEGRLLEMGCGAGDITLWLAEKGYEVYGVDIAPTAIAWAEEKARERGLGPVAHFQVGDVRDLIGYSDDFFDLVLDGRCLHCIIGDDRAKFLASASRVLRPGGFLHINTICGEPRSQELKKNFDPVTRCQVFGDVAVRYCGLAESILEELRASGFDILTSKIVAQPEGEGEDLLQVDAVKAMEPESSPKSGRGPGSSGSRTPCFISVPL
ncbi:MAG: class I SAM-dependent methyltransferase [Armatimonadota bacterium]